MPLFSRKKTVLRDAVQSTWKSEDEREALLEQLRSAEMRAIDAVPLLYHQDASFRKVGVEQFLAAPKPEALKALIQGMGDKPAHVRAYVARIFPRVPADIMRPVVEELIVHNKADQKRLGWEVALSLGGELRRTYLERAVLEAPPAQRGVALQRLLQESKAHKMVDLLVSLAEGDDPRLGSTALKALAEVQDPRIVSVMVKAFMGEDATLREIASRYLQDAAERDPEGMRKKMMDLMSSGEDSNRRQAVEILLRTGEPIDVLTDVLVFCRELTGWLRNRILETLQTFGDEVLRPAVQLLNHPDEEVRTSALVLAEGFKDPRLVGPIVKLLEDDDWWLRVIACESLGRLGDERAVPFLIKALNDEDARWAAIEALAAIGSPSALKPFSQLLRSDRQEVRLEIIKAFSLYTDKRLLPLLKAVAEKDQSSEVRTRAAEVFRDMANRLKMDGGSAEAHTAAVSSSALKSPLDKLLAMIREQGASDLHVTVDEPPFVRLTGGLERMELRPLSAEQTEKAVLSMLNARQRKIFEELGQIDLCYAIPEVGRYRVNAYRQRKGVCAAFRVIPNVPPTFADLGLPGHLTELLDYHQGIIVVSGPAGSGKSTTLAALVNLINETKPDHVLTLEDPIEFVHPVKTALVNQREMNGTHSESFSRALRGALRQDPDVIMVGEMRDLNTIRQALTAAETGHLVIATLNTTSAVQTIERLVTAFPPDEQAQVRMALSESLKYVISQSLIKRADGKGRVGVFEILKGTLSIGNLIRDGKTFQIPSMMQIGQNLGMQTVDMALMDLYEAGAITAETAWLRADKPETFAPMCDPSFLAGSDMAPETET
ncbi:MAG: PilT/PilU family type 4a pilus ATPase [Alphaproteobacteria bacterium]|nr:PilT/PilU family type 4a pilus ATPase [Alphaproteobacteria bacterium]